MAQITKQYTFTNGTKADPVQVNADFDALFTQANAQDTSIVNLLGITTNMWVNVKDPKYGAKGDGVSDDTAAIQATINAANSVSGCVVYAPSGTYSISSDLVIPSNVIIVGAGKFKTIFKVNGTVINCFKSTDTSGVEIRDLSIDGNSKKGAFGIVFDGVYDFIIENIYIHDCGTMNAPVTSDGGFGGYGIIVKGNSRASQRGIIRNIKVERIAGGGTNAGDGIYISAFNASLLIKTNHIIVENCWVSTCGRHCYTVAGGAGAAVPEYIKFVNCYAEKSALSGLDIEIGNYVSVEQCSFANCGNDQTYYNPAVVYGATFGLMTAISMTNSMSNIKISYNDFNTCYTDIRAGNTQYVEIDHNTSLNCLGDSMTLYSGSGITDSIVSYNTIIKPTGLGIFIFNSINLKIIGNTVFSAGNYGMKLATGVDKNYGILIEQNVINGGANYGLYLQGCRGIVVHGNIIKNNTAGIYIDSGGGSAVTDITVEGNIVFDDQTVKTQTYPIVYNISTGTQNWLLVVGNNFRGNINAKPVIAGANSIDANNLG